MTSQVYPHPHAHQSQHRIVSAAWRGNSLHRCPRLFRGIGPAPPPTRDWTPEAKTWWETVHASAISVEWTPDDLLVVSRALSQVVDLAAIESDSDLTLKRRARLKINLSAEIRLMESSLGLSPAGRSRLRVEVVRAETAEQRGDRSPHLGSETDDELARRRDGLRARIEAER